MLEGLVVGHELVFYQLHQRLIEGLHPVGRVALGDHFRDLFGAVLVTDAFTHEGGRHQDFEGGYPAIAVSPGHEALGDDGFEDRRQLQANLLLLVRREN